MSINKEEKWLRNCIQKEIARDNKARPTSILQEQGELVKASTDEMYDAFLKPWADLFNIVKIEAAKTLDGLVTNLKLFTTFDSKKSKQILNRYKGRSQAAQDKVDGMISQMKYLDEYSKFAFIINPGVYLGIGLAKATPDVAKGVVAWGKTAGLGDWAADELETTGATKREKRKEGEKGMLSKTLTALEDIFLLRLGAEHAGPLLQEAKDISSKAMKDVNRIGQQEFGDLQQEIIQDSKEVVTFVEKLKSQIGFLISIKVAKSADDIMAAANTLRSMAPEIDLGAIESFPQQLEADVKTLAAEEESKIQAAKLVLKKKGNNDPAEEDIAGVAEAEIEEELRNGVFSKNIEKLRAGVVNELAAIMDVSQNLIDEMKPKGVDSDIEKIIMDSPFGQNLNKAQTKLNQIKASVGI